MADRPKHVITGDPLLWTMVLYDLGGQEIDADANPTFKVFKNGVLLADSIVVVKRTLGTYDCSYLSVDPTEEGDQFTVEEFALIGGITYKNAWEFIVNAQDARGSGVRAVEATVKNDDLQLMSGVVVNVLDAGGTPLGFSDSTDTLGIARFNLNDGDYQFVCSAVPGYQSDIPLSYSVSVSQTTPQITLYKDVVEEVEDVPSVIDQSGIKKVKTKHMEIEKFDPRIMQDVRDRELAAPTFCDSHFCVGVPKRRCS